MSIDAPAPRRVGSGELAVCLLGLGLWVTRSSLVLHEVVGHALPAWVFSAQIDLVRLLFFGGGYVRWSGARFSTMEALLVSTGGIAVELAMGALLLALAARRPPGGLRFALLTAGALDGLHAAFYLAIGVQDGFGDGVPLYRALGAARAWVSGPAAVVVVGGGLLFARVLVRTLLDWVRPPRARLRVAAALLVASGGHFALMQVELALRQESFFAERSAESEQRRIARAIEDRQSAAIARGETPSEALRARWADEAEADPPLPFKAILLPALVIAVLIGAYLGDRDPRTARAPPTARTVAGIWLSLGVMWLLFGLTWP